MILQVNVKEKDPKIQIIWKYTYSFKKNNKVFLSSKLSRANKLL